ncbi:FAD-dependent oxidoreductase domain-containing protein 2-like [Mya arenaria]|uniref:FAD-dependent oxidoreductase domain-containing protein 2-like n=1 Tax=Mya arenaria TaxID=6604 RepID=UPI0022E732ED|nr:FAD-dependent oxidoreductase domain-containing protein 2-like [Mya arenaria]XP_052772124.1 FAD-dependent oxidoreductase domain-containing protein 2-like [Mya arenaria]XP_052772135.1 FAD-dependent oxidoreductase domain-containing protein 2-like [Mya arenaria]
MKEPSACVMFFLALTVILGLSYGVQGGYQDYCVIGAGPSGLQMGYFLASAGRDYIIFERSNVSGNFYVNYPRHRKLISINKRWTGKTNKEFNLRHDWNSLLSHDESLQFTKYSKEMFPSADRYLDYLRDYQQRLALNVQFNTEIRNVRKEVCEGAPDGHVYTMVDQRDVPYKCGRLIIATGIGKPNIPDIEGMDLVDGYEDMSLNKDDYEGQTVLILGRGNSAFETATHIYGSTNLIHMIARSRVRLSWATHYVGDLRAINNELLDTYQLKSLDGVLEASLSEVAIVKDADGKLALKIVDSGPEEESEDTFDNFAMREPYDRIIRCLGFTFDNSIFNETMKISFPKGRAKKYPSINHNYESVDHTGMFVAGTASHSLDFRKSAGGFIHGFRYSARALHRLLEWRYHGNAWPSTTVPHQQLLTHILKRINEASGIYQMFSVLGDVIILGNETYTYLEEFPINLVHNLYEMSGHKGSKIIVLNLQYGPNFSGPGNDIFRLDRATGDPSDAHKSNFLHPAFYYYEKLPTEHQMKYKGMSNHLPRPDLLHHIVEDFLTTWDASTSHILPLRRFLENVLNKDMRNYFAEDCMEMALTNLDVPYSCQEFYMNGAGLAGSTLHMSK